MSLFNRSKEAPVPLSEDQTKDEMAKAAQGAGPVVIRAEQAGLVPPIPTTEAAAPTPVSPNPVTGESPTSLPETSAAVFSHSGPTIPNTPAQIAGHTLDKVAMNQTVAHLSDNKPRI